MFGSSTNSFAALSTENEMSADPDIAVTGEDAEEVSTEIFGFLALNGDTKVKLLPDGFSESSMPISSASLFTVANQRGLFAAAGPSTFVLGTSESLRRAFASATTGSTVTTYQPSVSLSAPTPISHIAFNASEHHLILGAASGGLAVYSVDSLMASNSQSLFELGTNGLPLREVKPNPNPDFAHLIAVLTQNGEFRLFNLNQRVFVPGKQGTEVLKTGISTLNWSQRGKQLICGLTDGTCSQITPEGDERAVIPKPPGLTNFYVSHVTWLENNLFVIALTPVPSNPQEPNNDSIFYVFTRSSNTENFRFQKLPDPTPPFGMTIRQTYHFCGEIKHWSPHLQDALILANTSSADVGLITRFSNAIPATEPSNPSIPEGAFTTTTIADDSRRAALPLGEDYCDTSPIGMILDLSSRDKVIRPIPGEELEETDPQPIFMLLNNEGVVSAWHIIYSDAVRGNSEYQQLTVVKEKAAPSSVPQAAEAQKTTAFGVSGASPFQSFGAAATTTAPTFGAPAFGAPAFSQTATPAKPAFGQPAFGQGAFGKPAFGQSGWGSISTTSSPAFGQPAFGSSAFGKPSTTTPPPTTASTFGSGSGFSKFASAGGFASIAASTAAGEGPAWAKGGLGSTTISSPFGTSSNNVSVFGSLSNNTSSFGGLSSTGSGSGLGSTPFKIGSTFQADSSASTFKTSEDKGPSLFGSAFGSSLGSTLKATPTDADMDADSPRVSTPVDKEEDMDSSPAESALGTPEHERQLVPPAAPAGGLSGDFGSTNVISKGMSVFGTAPTTPPLPKQESPKVEKTPPPAPLPPSPKVTDLKLESPKSPPSAPLPPDPTSKPSKDTVPDIPLPPVPIEKADTTKAEPEKTEKEDKEEPPKSLLDTSGVPGKPGTISAFSQTFTSGLKPPSTGVFSQPPQIQTPASATSPSKPTVTSVPTFSSTGPFVAKPTPAPKNAFATTTEPLPPLPGSAIATKKDTKPSSSVFDAPPPPDLDGGIFSNLSKQKAKLEKAERNQKAEAVSRPSRISAPAGPKSVLAKKPDTTRAKSAPVNPMRFGLAHSRRGQRPSLLAKKYPEEEEVDEEYDENEEELEEEGDEGHEEEEYDEEETEIDEPEGVVPEKKPTAKYLKPKFPTLTKLETQPSAELVISQPVTQSPVPQRPPPPPEPEDERIWKLLHSPVPVEPNPNPPDFTRNDKIVEASPDDGFEAIYDKAYESCNVMVNSIGMMARNLEAYVSAHRTSAEYPKHCTTPPPRTVKEVDEWRLCELSLLQAIIQRSDQINSQGAIARSGLDEMVSDLTKGLVRLQTKISELQRLADIHKDPRSVAAMQSRYLTPEQTLQQRELRNKLAAVQFELEETEKAVTILKANLAARDRGKMGGKVKPPTVEAVNNTIMKLTAMVERKNGDVDYLGEQLRRLQMRSSLGGASKADSPSFTRTLVFGTPAKNKGKGKMIEEGASTVEAADYSLVSGLQQLEIDETKEDIAARREIGGKLRIAMKLAGTRVTRG
ncbi:hypothetical protein BDZ91DRAFT_708301 [Kalaharituber pfeilii]|nr:hypothetical protein BDZ91DRAFT_708301 [Kalaharituber pfeilii]